MKTYYRSLVFGCSMLALAACGPEEIASPGQGGDIIINNPDNGGGGGGGGGGGANVVAADSCPDITGNDDLTDGGVENNGAGGTFRVCVLPAKFNTTTTLPYVSGVAYAMDGRVDVGDDGGFTAGGGDTNVTLNIQAGVTIYARENNSYLVVNRGNKINATGNLNAPIIFTSENNVKGLTTDDSQQEWGGIVLLGRAQTTDCDFGTEAGNNCERDTEGAAVPAIFGGENDNDSSGTIRYVQARYSGFVIGADSELQSLTLGSVGNGTTIDYFQSVNSSDDAIEFFGGDIRAKHLVLIGADDDNLDTDTGARGFIQYVIAVQRTGKGDAMIEADSNNSNQNAIPRQDMVVSNATFIQRDGGSDLATILIRGGADYALLNSVVYAPNYACLRLSQSETVQDAGTDENGPPVFESVVMTCDDAFITVDADDDFNESVVADIFNDGSNNSSTFTSTLTSTFVNGANENAVAVFNPTSYSAFFENPSNIGAVFPGNTTWYQTWTCNSTAANLNGATNCAASPVT